MALPWKSFDGGSIHKVGTSNASGTAGGLIVVNVSNPNGIIVWNAWLFCSGTTRAYLGAETAVLLYAANGSPSVNGLPYPVFIPAGVTLAVYVETGTSLGWYVNYDIL